MQQSTNILYTGNGTRNIEARAGECASIPRPCAETQKHEANGFLTPFVNDVELAPGWGAPNCASVGNRTHSKILNYLTAFVEVSFTGLFPL